MGTTKAIALISLLICSISICAEFAVAFDIKRGAPSAVESVFEIESADRELPSGSCESLSSDLEATRLGMRQLSEPFSRNGVNFGWVLGEGKAITYWNRQQLDDGQFKVDLFFLDFDLQISFVATATAQVISDNEMKSGIKRHSLVEVIEPDGSMAGQSFILFDQSSREGLHIGYVTKLIKTDTTKKLEARPNSEIRFVRRGMVRCRNLIDNN
jgi:hypothetical protein